MRTVYIIDLKWLIVALVAYWMMLGVALFIGGFSRQERVRQQVLDIYREGGSREFAKQFFLFIVFWPFRIDWEGD